jgi:hypothetical protein
MRIKWTAIPSVMGANSAAPSWAGAGPAERPKKEAIVEREPDKKEKKKKSERALEWLRRNR